MESHAGPVLKHLLANSGGVWWRPCFVLVGSKGAVQQSHVDITVFKSMSDMATQPVLFIPEALFATTQRHVSVFLQHAPDKWGKDNNEPAYFYFLLCGWRGGMWVQYRSMLTPSGGLPSFRAILATVMITTVEVFMVTEASMSKGLCSAPSCGH